MEEKHNNSTAQRPEGARTLDTTFLPIDLKKFSSQLISEEAYHKNRKNAITVFKSDRVTITLIALQTEEVIKPGREEKEAIMTLQVVKGVINFESFEKKVIVKEEELVVLHDQLSFLATAETDSLCLLTVVK